MGRLGELGIVSQRKEQLWATLRRSLQVEKHEGKAWMSRTQEKLSKGRGRLLPKLFFPFCPRILIITRENGNAKYFLILIAFTICQTLDLEFKVD